MLVIPHPENNTTSLFQTNPIPSTDGFYPDARWTASIAGYCKAAKDLASCLLYQRRNLKTDCRYFATINVDEEHEPDRVKAEWNRIVRRMRKHGVIGLWVREVNRRNRVHYHLLIRSLHRTADDLADLLRQSMPKDVPTRVHVGNVRKYRKAVRYILKCKIEGKRDGQPTKDVYYFKRKLFLPGLGLRKVGTVGKFWVIPKAKIWEKIKQREKKIGDNSRRPEFHHLRKHLADIFPHDLDSFAVRGIAYNLDSEPLKRWRDSLPADPAPFDPFDLIDPGTLSPGTLRHPFNSRPAA